MSRRFYAVTGVVEPISALRCHFRRQSAISGAEIDVVARSVTHSAIVASADGERESNQFSPPFCPFYSLRRRRKQEIRIYLLQLQRFLQKEAEFDGSDHFAHCFSGDVDKEEK